MSSSGANTSGYLPPPTGVPLALGASTPATHSLPNAAIIAGSINIPLGVTITALGVEVTGAGDAGCTLVPVIYKDTGNGRPGNLLIAGTAVPGDATGVQSAAAALTIPPGWYWAGALLLGAPVTQPTLRTAGPPGLMATGNVNVYGANVSTAWNCQQSGLAAPPAVFTPAVTTFSAPVVVIHT